MVRLGEVGPIICEELNAKWSPFFKLPVIDYRKLAHKRKLERELFEKYGHYKDIILDSRFQAVKHYLEEVVEWDIILGEPIIPLSTVVMILFLVARNAHTSFTVLIAALLLNLNPIYVTILVVLLILRSPRVAPKRYRNLSTPRKSVCNTLPQTVNHFLSSDLSSEITDDSRSTFSFDHILVGGDMAALYTAALLSECGHRCCVLQPNSVDPLLVLHAPCYCNLSTLMLLMHRHFRLL